MSVLLVALGGVIGSVLRWQLFEALPTLALGVFLVNQLGVLAAGFVAYRQKTTEYQRLFWITGFAGGFTTLSSFAFVLQGATPLGGFIQALGSLFVSIIILKLIKGKAKS